MFMLKLNWKQGGQSRPYSSFNIALGPIGLSIRFLRSKGLVKKSGGDFYVEIELEAGWPVETLFQL